MLNHARRYFAITVMCPRHFKKDHECIDIQRTLKTMPMFSMLNVCCTSAAPLLFPSTVQRHRTGGTGAGPVSLAIALMCIRQWWVRTAPALTRKESEGNLCYANHFVRRFWFILNEHSFWKNSIWTCRMLWISRPELDRFQGEVFQES